MSTAKGISGELARIDRGVGLLLVGHGTREVSGTEEFLQVAAEVARRCEPLTVEPCFLEFAAPTIKAGFRRLVERGATRVVVVPVLLFAAGHARRDIPHEVARVAAEFPGIEVRQAAHLGCHEKLLDLSAQRYLEARVSGGAEPAWLVLAGRGSHDAEATAEMHQYARLLGERLQTEPHPPARVVVGFVAMAEPALDAVLDEAMASGARQVVVQPHLLFGGVLAERIADRTSSCAQCDPQRRWVAAKPLGPVTHVVEALVDRALAELSRHVWQAD